MEVDIVSVKIGINGFGRIGRAVFRSGFDIMLSIILKTLR